MDVVKTIKEMQKLSDGARVKGLTIGFVPTMGYLHDGHLELVRRAKKAADVGVVSIFVNPTQFVAGEDLEAYPRDLERDLKLLETLDLDYVYHPEADEMYLQGYQTFIEVPGVSAHLCGISRPTHFRGVATVCAKLFNAVKPHYAFFGEKDFQQVAVVSRMVKDLNMDLQIVPVSTVREADGLAMSSRNIYLTEDERKRALVLKRSLDKALQLYREGESSAIRIKEEVEQMIREQKPDKIDYIAISNQETMEEVDEVDEKAFIAMAVKFGKARLIDNCKFTKGE